MWSKKKKQTLLDCRRELWEPLKYQGHNNAPDQPWGYSFYYLGSLGNFLGKEAREEREASQRKWDARGSHRESDLRFSDLGLLKIGKFQSDR